MYVTHFCQDFAGRQPTDLGSSTVHRACRCWYCPICRRPTCSSPSASWWRRECCTCRPRDSACWSRQDSVHCCTNGEHCDVGRSLLGLKANEGGTVPLTAMADFLYVSLVAPPPPRLPVPLPVGTSLQEKNDILYVKLEEMCFD